jgi:hypothetical protein
MLEYVFFDQRPFRHFIDYLLTGPQLLDRVEALLPDHRERLYPPTETLSMFLAQALSSDGSCRQVVDDAMVKRGIGGLKPGSTDTGSYCKARSRLPGTMVSTLAFTCRSNPLMPSIASSSTLSALSIPLSA